MSATTNKKNARGLKREASPLVIGVALLVVLLGIGTGVYYLANNGWRTQAQKDAFLYHDYLPLKALQHGDRGPFDAENALRKREGKPPLVDDMNKPVRTRDEEVKLGEDNLKRAKALEAAGGAQ